MGKYSAKIFLEGADRVHFSDRRLLPSISGIYAITDLKEVFYVGQSINIHHRCGLSGPDTHIMFSIPSIHNMYIAYLPADPSALLEVERNYISEIYPPYNSYGKDSGEAQVKFRVSAMDKDRYERIASEAGKNLSDYLRDAIAFHEKYKDLVEAFRIKFINDL